HGAWVQDYESFFDAPVSTDRPCMALVLPRALGSLGRSSVLASETVLTHADVLRDVASLPRSFIEAVMRVIDLHLAKRNPDIESTARTLSLGSRTLQRRLKEESTTFRALLTARRMKRARDLLVETTLSVSEVAEQLAYADPPQFMRAFKIATGTTPSAYRSRVTG
ncbi:MAG: helix-turn-helix transcriptional regulator, partial [Myxococcota bacterium]